MSFQPNLQSGDKLEMWDGIRVGIVYMFTQNKETGDRSLIELNHREREQLIQYLIAMRGW